MSSARERASALAADAGKPAPLARVSPRLDYAEIKAIFNDLQERTNMKIMNYFKKLEEELEEELENGF